MWIPTVVHLDQQCLGSTGMYVRSLAQHNRLRIQRLAPAVARVATVAWIRSLPWDSMCSGAAQKLKNKTNKKQTVVIFSSLAIV